jgi:hypothetical protein
VASSHCPASWLNSGALELPITLLYAAFSSNTTTTWVYVAGAVTPGSAQGSANVGCAAFAAPAPGAPMTAIMANAATRTMTCQTRIAQLYRLCCLFAKLSPCNTADPLARCSRPGRDSHGRHETDR